MALQYLAWVSYPMILVTFASLFCHLVAPQAIGRTSSVGGGVHWGGASEAGGRVGSPMSLEVP